MYDGYSRLSGELITDMSHKNTKNNGIDFLDIVLISLIVLTGTSIVLGLVLLIMELIGA